MTERECANGRRRYRSRKEAEQLAAEFEGSGLTQEEFCERNDVSRNALARYLKRQRRREADAGQRWVAVEVAAGGATGSGLSVALGGGRRIEVGRGFDAATLRQLVTALERL
jgi:transcriptional regulator with XRE-family HTH domain